MFDIGFLEIILCGIVALVVIGPEKLPHAARMAGAFIGKFTRLAQSVREDIEREVNLMEMQERIKQQVEKGVLGDIKDNVDQAKRMLREGYDQASGTSAPSPESPAAGTPSPAVPAALAASIVTDRQDNEPLPASSPSPVAAPTAAKPGESP
jgi:sec-independent protein translocase protein TatB